MLVKSTNMGESRPGGPYIPVAAFNYYNAIFHGQEIGWENPLVFSDNKKKIGRSLKSIR